jgi:nucleoside 2-deoxyribosyltransferase
MKLYLAGPMRGYPEYNFPAFHKAAAELRAVGYTVWSPAERDESEGFNPKTDASQPLKYYMKYDLPAVLESDAIALLEGWERSTGANLEVHVARAVGMPVYLVEQLLENPIRISA